MYAPQGTRCLLLKIYAIRYLKCYTISDLCWSMYIQVFLFVFLKFLADTCPFLGPLVPLFWISGDISSGFQSQSGFCLIRYFCGGECNIHSPRFTSGATLADLRFERATARTEDERATIVPATRLIYIQVCSSAIYCEWSTTVSLVSQVVRFISQK